MNVTIKHLEAVVSRLNALTGSPETYGQNTGSGYKTNVGHFHLDRAYGGNKLVRTCNESGGINEISVGGYISKGSLCNQINAMINLYYEVK